ncbi:hypothetical protein F511_38190 [Dorcoceras hygrometricum]|uniref:Uncharacterized protein n=1 Tax=Dorcoceras hygrometricum TaxID=472368 RepID=A0A2Z7AYW5_9LAMI|nr:hypothetical protein F511_38190 [Dorcoceras hygrometricum]
MILMAHLKHRYPSRSRGSSPLLLWPLLTLQPLLALRSLLLLPLRSWALRRPLKRYLCWLLRRLSPDGMLLLTLPLKVISHVLPAPLSPIEDIQAGAVRGRPSWISKGRLARNRFTELNFSKGCSALNEESSESTKHAIALNAKGHKVQHCQNFPEAFITATLLCPTDRIAQKAISREEADRSERLMSKLRESQIGLSMSKKIEKMKVKKHLVRANHVECHQKFQARIHEAEDSMQAQHLLIEALVDEKDNLLQTIHDLQEANNARAPFDGDWEEEPKEEPEEIEDIPLGKGEIDDD